MSSFDHERLEVYPVGVEFLGLADGVVTAFPPGRAYLGDQLHRASTSIILNIAEGAGEFSKRDKARFYRMALRSATECAAILDVARCLRRASQGQLTAGRGLLLRIVAMLVKLVRQMAKSGTGSGTGQTRGGP
jgi:four helix bundle protein